MKTTLSRYLLLLLLVPATMLADGEKGKYEKEKKINRSFNVSATAMLDLSNKYGDVDIQTWNEDRITIDVMIRISGNNESDVTKRLNSINVDFDATQAMVSAKTTFGKFSGKTSKMQINYVVRIPNKGGLDLHNQYGNVLLGKINGPTNIDVDYGDLRAEELTNSSNDVEISYSHGSKIGIIKAGELSPQYSTLTIGKAGTLKIDGQYSNLNIGELENADFDVDYGKFNVQSAGRVSGTSNYVETNFGSIQNLLNITANYGQLRISAFGKSAKNIAINSNYTSIYLPGSADTAYDFEFELEYSNINGGSGYHYTERDVKGRNGRYKGYNNRSGGTRVFIDSQYGNIHVGNTSAPSAPAAPQAPKAPKNLRRN